MIKVQRNRGSEGKNTRGRKGGRGGGWKKESGNKTPLRERRESQVGMEVTLCDVAWSFHLSSLQLKAAWKKGPAFSKNRIQYNPEITVLTFMCLGNTEFEFQDKMFP